MSDFIEAEWWTAGRSVGAVLVYDQEDGFKCYLGATSQESDVDETYDIAFVRRQGVKVSVEVAYGIFGKRMVGEFMRRNLWDKSRCTFKYDGKKYNAKVLIEVME